LFPITWRKVKVKAKGKAKEWNDPRVPPTRKEKAGAATGVAPGVRRALKNTREPPNDRPTDLAVAEHEERVHVLFAGARGLEVGLGHGRHPRAQGCVRPAPDRVRVVVQVVGWLDSVPSQRRTNKSKNYSISSRGQGQKGKSSFLAPCVREKKNRFEHLQRVASH
jgi:hypothetical protein